jgi:hypothetical protein
MTANEFLAELEAAHDAADGLAGGANALLWTKLEKGAVTSVAEYRDALERRRGLISEARDALRALIDDGYPDQPSQSVADDVRAVITRRLADVQAVAEVFAAPKVEPIPEVPVDLIQQEVT